MILHKVCRLLLITGAAITAVFWTARLASMKAEAAYKAANQLVSDAALINGARMTLNDNSALELITDYKPSPSSRTLVLVLSDTCPGVKALLPKWKEILAGLPTDGTVSVALVSFSGQQTLHELATGLTAKGIPHQVYSVVAPRKFRLSTGIGSTPFTIILDSDFRLRAVAIAIEPQFEPAVERMLVASLRNSKKSD